MGSIDPQYLWANDWVRATLRKLSAMLSADQSPPSIGDPTYLLRHVFASHAVPNQTQTLPIIPHAVPSYAWEASQGFLREHHTACEGHLTSRLQAFRLWLVTSKKKTPVLVLYISPWLSSRSEVILGYETLTELVQLVTTSADFNNSSHQIPEDPLQSRSHPP